ncbi:MAG TPA: GAF domain-containing protein [Candidatus Binatia bacterium]|nr:GAF domain-containing protein [Candidatus Binatia bacterium]
MTKTVARYTLYGALFGLAFPIMATLVDIWARGLPLHPFSVFFVQVTQPLNWIIDSAPLVLGATSAFIGMRQQALEALNEDLTHAVSIQTSELVHANENLRSRAAQLELIVRIVRRVSGILDRRELVTSVVDIIGETLNYYHVHIYLFDEQRQYLVINGGTGEAGLNMALQGHRIPVGKGLVGRAADSNLAVIVPDVSKDRNWLPNPLLPDTRAEVAVPIRRGDRVLGVLDVQHDVVDGLDRSDADVLQTIADQIAVAMENAQLYEQVQQRAEQEILLNNIAQKIQSTTSVDDALRVTVRELGWALNGARASVRIHAGEPAAGESTT